MSVVLVVYLFLAQYVCARARASVKERVSEIFNVSIAMEIWVVVIQVITSCGHIVS